MRRQENKICFLALLAIIGIFHSLHGEKYNQTDYAKPLVAISRDTVPENFLERYFTGQTSEGFIEESLTPKRTETLYDDKSNTYTTINRLGRQFWETPKNMTFNQYLELQQKETQRKYYDILAKNVAQSNDFGVSDPIVRLEKSDNLIVTLFGSPEVKFNPTGNVDITMGYAHHYTKNDVLEERQKRNGNLDFDMDIVLNVEGQVGEKLKMNANFNPKATFNFDQNIKLAYDSENFSEDEIVKTLEAGNVALPLNNSLIQGSQRLFGIKMRSQFGRLRLTTVLSQQQSEVKSTGGTGGAIDYEFEVTADDYQENRHYFLAHYFKEVFDDALENLPQILSQVRITNIEVWVTNENISTVNQSRNILAIADLAEGDVQNLINSDVNISSNAESDRGHVLPENDANSLYQDILNSDATNINITNDVLSGGEFQMKQGIQFEKTDARRLSRDEYVYNPELGTLSLRRALAADHVLAVAFEYSYRGQFYRVGQLSTKEVSDSDEPDMLILKMLKSTTPNIGYPTWDLMMKNVYGLNAYSLEQDGFELDIYYEEPALLPNRYLPEKFGEKIPLLNLFHLDRTNQSGDPQPDGRFDYISGLTINPTFGTIMFPVREPFGKFLQNELDPNPLVDSLLVFDELYRLTQTAAREFTEKNRFVIRGKYKTRNGNIIPLGGFNFPRGSIRVSSGGRTLTEGVDYRVDYGAGYVEILNDQYLGPSTPINVSYEDQNNFGFNRKSMAGIRADYDLNRNFQLGATILHLGEKPFSQKVDIGNDPINNTVYGLDLHLNQESGFVTRMVDALPGLSTTAPSNISLNAETAFLKPGHSRAINNGDQGIIYLDDFEGSSNRIPIRTNYAQWTLASLPVSQMKGSMSGVDFGANRSAISWYRIESRLQDESSGQDAYVKFYRQTDVFKNRDLQNLASNYLVTFDIHFDPTRRGPYNYDIPGGRNGISAGVEPGSDGEVKLLDPKSRWAGIQSSLFTNDFEESNYEAIEFWVLDPFLERDPANGHTTNRSGGKLIFNLGNISEDVLRDSRMTFENGFSSTGNPLPEIETEWGKAPNSRNITKAFDTDVTNREQQDIGYDGLENEEEREFLADYLASLGSSNLYPKVYEDPSNDDYVPYRDVSFNDNDYILDRYLEFNKSQGNSQVNTDQFQGNSTNIPNDEDINNDNTLNEIDAYFEYEIDLSADNGTLGEGSKKYLVDQVTASSGETWYKFKIPLTDYSEKVGEIQDLRSVRFIRMYLTDFEEEVTLRFASLDFIKNNWRTYLRGIAKSSVGVVETEEDGQMSVSSVNIEENSGKLPFNYVLPKDIKREQFWGQNRATQQNEQSMQIQIDDLPGRRGRGVYKLLGNIDLRDYEKMKMYVHLENRNESNLQSFEDVSAYVRIGDDFNYNFYEYELPLQVSDEDNASPTNIFEYQEEVWPTANIINFPLSLFTDLKKQREVEALSPDEIYGNSMAHPIYNEEGELINTGTVRVLGNPSLGNPKSIMIGLYNNKTGDPIDAEIWFNELSLKGLNERGGMAATVNLDISMADFARVSFAGNYRSVGYGALNQKLIERRKDALFSFDINSNFELGKFFPERWGVQLPVYYQYGNNTVTPRFDPVYEDLRVSDALDIAQTNENVDETDVKDRSRISADRQSFGANNVRVAPQNDRKPAPWRIGNFSASYESARTVEKSPEIERNYTRQQRGSLTYQFSLTPRYIYPVKKNLEKNKWLQLISEFNFNPIPNGFTAGTQMNRMRSERKYRYTPDNDGNTWVSKQFLWNRNYNLNWDFTKSLKFRFDAINDAVVDELNENPANGYDPNFVFNQAENDELVRNSIRDFGRNKNYGHNISLSYTLPIKYLPFMDFVSVTADARANYNWSAAPFTIGAEPTGLDSLGNTIQNGQTLGLRGSLDMLKLYNQSGYLKRIENYRMKSTAQNQNQSNQPNQRQRNNGQQGSPDEKEKKGSGDPSIGELILIRPLLMVKNVRGNYEVQYNNTVPGYLPTTHFLGMNSKWQYPGWDFILGFRPTDGWLDQLARDNQFTTYEFQNQDVVRNESYSYSYEFNLEPYRDLQIDINADKNFARNDIERFLFDGNQFIHANPFANGSMTISYLSINTLIGWDPDAVFDRFENNRTTISERLNPSGDYAADGYKDGYGAKQRDVVLPAFLAAYSNRNPNRIHLDPFDMKPAINWDVQFQGLTNIPALAEVFRNVNLRHSYKNNLNINRYQTNVDFDQNNPFEIDSSNSYDYFFSRYEIPQMVISESLSPLIGVDIQTNGQLNVRLDYSRSRNLLFFANSLGNENNNITTLEEDRESRITTGIGYTFTNVFIPFLHGKKQKSEYNREKREAERSSRGRGGKQREGDETRKSTKKQYGNDLNLSFDFSYSDRETINHVLDSDVEGQISRGNTNWQFSPAVEYKITDNILLKSFLNYKINEPKTNNSFLIRDYNLGMTLRYILN